MEDRSMKYKTDGINMNELYWMIEDMKWGFFTVEHLARDVNWKIEYWSSKRTHGLDLQPPRKPEQVQIYKKSYMRGDIPNPIVAVGGNIIDGQHKLGAQREVRFKYFAVATPAGKGIGEVVKDTVYAPMVEGFKPKKYPGYIRCIVCGEKMNQSKDCLECGHCGYKFTSEFFLGWTVIKR